MIITNYATVHCLFEQSGTFKNEFAKMGIAAKDYDIQDNFGETDHKTDLFKEIDNAYDSKPSLFDNISPNDLIIAFFPCIYFTGSSNPCYFTLNNMNYRLLTDKQKFDKIIERANKRNDYYILLYKMIAICIFRKLRIIIENPFSSLHFLHNNFIKPPDIIDHNRQRRGDYFSKPTGYWFFNCEPTHGNSFQSPIKKLRVRTEKPAQQTGICSEQRSIISPDYARNFICDFIIGKSQVSSQLSLFEQ